MLRAPSKTLRSYQNIAIFLAIISVAGCQTTGDGNLSTGGKYNFFFTQADHVKELLQKEKALEASDIYNQNVQFFVGKGKSQDALLSKLKSKTDAALSTKAAAAIGSVRDINWPAPPEGWAQLGKILADAKSTLDKLKSNKILLWNGTTPSLGKLKRAIREAEDRILDSSTDEFLKYGLLKIPPFEQIYPVEIEISKLLNASEATLIEDTVKYDLADLIAVLGSYGTRLSNGLQERLAGRHYELFKDKMEQDGHSTITASIRSLIQTKEVGFTLSSEQGLKVLASDISSQTLVRSNQFDFPIQLETALPIQIKKSSLDSALNENIDADVVILLDVAAAKTERDIQTYRKVPSEKKIGTQSVLNPAYSGAQNAVTQAQLNVQTAQMSKMSVDNQYCQGWGCLGKAVGQIAAGAQVGKANKAMQSAMSNLQATPAMLEEPVYRAYNFRSAEVSSKKSAVVNFYLIDQRTDRYVKDSFDAVESEEFKVAYGIDVNDRYKSRHLGDHDTENEVEEFESEEMTVSVDDLLQQFIATEEYAKILPNEGALRQAIVEDKNIVLAKFQEDRIKESTNTEFNKLAESVVAMFHPDGRSMGSGFYVNDDLVITNQHVVGDAKFIELKRKDGLESFGKVIAVDIARDIALLKVETRGSPVAFYPKSDLPVGETVIAIGHPRGLEFSVSRGIISAVRQIAGNEASGGKTWHVQTDTAINPGNSGGPLFFNGQVIGMNTWARRQGTDSGLNFALHFKEIEKFLNKNGVNVRRGITKAES